MAPSKLLLAAAFGSIARTWTAELPETCGPAGCASSEDVLAEAEELNRTGVALLQRRLGENKRGSCQAQAPHPTAPSKATEYNGDSWPELCLEGTDDSHVLVMGDYGGLTCGDTESTGRDPLGGQCGHTNGEVKAKAAINIAADNDRGRVVMPIDNYAQFAVADQMRNRAKQVKFHYALNGGDNFYWGGLDTQCGHPMDQIHPRTRVQFDTIFEKMYKDLDFPFFSVLGNHDYGGMRFEAAWDQQVAYTFASDTTKRWILPALYWHQKVNYPDAGYSVDYFMVDTNIGDAKPYDEDEGHNICGKANRGGISCAANGGPSSTYDCLGWFQKLWDDQSRWLDEKLKASTATWQIIVSHFPPDAFNGRDYWKYKAVEHGIDLFVGSHRHFQKVYINSNYFGLNYVVCGGGGGITSEFNPDNSDWGRDQYGFMDLALSKEKLTLTAINHNGEVRSVNTIKPRPRGCERFDNDAGTCVAEATCANYGCKFNRGKPCQCSDSCKQYGNCCSDYDDVCVE